MKIRHIAALAALVLLALTACKQGTPEGQGAAAAVAQPSGQAASEQEELKISFTMTDSNGKEVSVADEFAKHEITLIDFWASWCGPCRQEMPNVVRIYDAYKDKGLGIIGVSLDESREQWLAAVDAMDMTWLQLSDLQGWHNSAAQKYGIQAIPFTVIVDNSGRVLVAGLRGEQLGEFIANRLGD